MTNNNYYQDNKMFDNDQNDALRKINENWLNGEQITSSLQHESITSQRQVPQDVQQAEAILEQPSTSSMGKYNTFNHICTYVISR